MREQAAMPMSDLNTTPLVDVMLVLLIIFMISAPLLTHRVPIPLAQPSKEVTPAPDQKFLIGVEATGGSLLWTLDGEPIAERELHARLQSAGRLARDQQPAFRLQAGESVRFDTVATLLAAGRRAGVERIGLAELSAP
ncbi:MAG: biopolymer transporter ExbD [Lysobacterales bacterium]